MKLLFYFLLAFALAPTIVLAEFSASYTAKGEPLPTLNEFTTFLESIEDEITTVSELDSVEYKGVIYKGLLFQTTGIYLGTKIDQKITYLEIFEGLYKLVFVEGDTCVRGTVLRDGEWVQRWACDEIIFPVRGVYGQLYILKDDKVDVVTLSKQWETKIISSEEAAAEKKKAENKVIVPVHKSLGDMKELMESQSFSWAIREGVWTSPSVGKTFDAFFINVSGKIDSVKTIEQEFIYVDENEEGLIRLKSIDGKICEYVERVEKVICADVYSPTRKTPFPLKLKNTYELSDQTRTKTAPKVEVVKDIKLKCGSLAENYGNALKFYFEGSSLSINEVSNFRKVFSNFPKILDPEKVLFSASDFDEFNQAIKEPYIFDTLLDKSLKEVLKGRDGSCDSLLPYIEDLEEKLVLKNEVFKSLLEKINLISIGIEDVSVEGFSQEETLLLKSILQAGDPAFKTDLNMFVDVALGSFKKYITAALELVSNKERFLVAAVYKQDVYSGLLPEEQRQNARISSDSEKKFFGVSFKNGVKSSYIFAVHPEVTELKPFDEILSINGEDIRAKTHSEVDSYFLDASKTLNMKVKRGEEILSQVLKSRVLNISKAFYSIKEIRNENKKAFVEIKLTSFSPGIAETLFNDLSLFLKDREVDGYILDLKDNKGGSAEEAFKIASFFVKNKNLGFYSIGYRWSAQRQPISSSAEFFIDEKSPLIVLVNQNSQSASEALAASLDALNRSFTVGERTFGKQVAQDFKRVNLSSGEAALAYITTSEYLDASGRSLNGKGLTPKLLVNSATKEPFVDGNSLGRDYEVPVKLIQEKYDLRDLEIAFKDLGEEILKLNIKPGSNFDINQLLVNKF